MATETLRDEPVGVAIGRFQTYNLTDGHKALIQKTLNHANSLVLIGTNPISGTKRNPLTSGVIAHMIRESFNYPRLNIQTLPDFPTDLRWTQEVDARIAELYPLLSARIYTGPDGIRESYSGRFAIESIDRVEGLRATRLREDLLRKQQSLNDSFRRGMIFQTMRLPSSPRIAVDGAITSNVLGMGPAVALIKKNGEELWRFPGGMVDFGDVALETAAKRELREELGNDVNFTAPTYVASARIADWRLRGTMASNFSAFFWARHLSGPIRAGDDAHSAGWFALTSETTDLLMDEHRFFYLELLEFVKKHPDLTGLRFEETK